MAGSAVDYNGNGDIDEGIYYELQGLQDSLQATFRPMPAKSPEQRSATTPDSHPYFFIDANANGDA